MTYRDGKCVGDLSCGIGKSKGRRNLKIFYIIILSTKVWIQMEMARLVERGVFCKGSMQGDHK